jgi:hypothetical protein
MGERMSVRFRLVVVYAAPRSDETRQFVGRFVPCKPGGEILDLTVIDETGTRTEQVSVPDTVAAGRIASRLVQVMGLPGAGDDGQPLSYGFHHERSGCLIGEEETLAQADVSEHDVLRLVAIAPARAHATTSRHADTLRQHYAPTPHQPPARRPQRPAEPMVLSPEPPPPSRRQALAGRRWNPTLAIALNVLAVAMAGVAVAIAVSSSANSGARVLTRRVIADGVSAETSATSADESSGQATGEGEAASSTHEGALPDVSTAQMESEVEQVLRSWHEAVVQGDYHTAWELLSQRKQVQEEDEGGYAAWAKNQSTLRPYLNPAGLRVSIQRTEPISGVAQVDVTGMTWDKPGAPCSQWSGITWVKYENGKWRYDPGYSTTPQREREWKSHYSELLGGSC